MENDTCPVTRNIPLMTLTGSNSNPYLWQQKCYNVVPENSKIHTNQTANKTSDEKEAELSERRESFVVFMSYTNHERLVALWVCYKFEEWPELRPEFAHMDYYGSKSWNVFEFASVDKKRWRHVSWQFIKCNHHLLSIGGKDSTDLEQDDDYIHWPKSPVPDWVYRCVRLWYISTYNCFWKSCWLHRQCRAQGQSVQRVIERRQLFQAWKWRLPLGSGVEGGGGEGG